MKKENMLKNSCRPRPIEDHGVEKKLTLEWSSSVEHSRLVDRLGSFWAAPNVQCMGLNKRDR